MKKGLEAGRSLARPTDNQPATGGQEVQADQ
jgi:hypothetical protein